jgi:hypothetical protein
VVGEEEKFGWGVGMEEKVWLDEKFGGDFSG